MNLPEEMIAVAENRISTFRQLKSEIDSKMAEVHEGLSQVRQMVKGSVQTTANPEGLLTRNEAEYLMCLNLKHVEFEQLLQKDEAHWAQNLLIVKRQAGEIQEQTKAWLEKAQAELDGMMNKSMSKMTLHNVSLEGLRKLQLWGE